MGDVSGEILTASKKTFLEKFTLEEIFLISQSHGFACALYRLPHPPSDLSVNKEDGVEKNALHLIIDLSPGRDLDHLHLEEMGKGFIFHPFSSDHHQVKFINRDIHITEDSISKKLNLIHSKVPIDELIVLFDSEKINKTINSGSLGNGNIITDQSDHEKADFIRLVDKSIQEIKSNELQKVVVARTHTISLPEQFNSFEFFKSLSDHYNNAFIYLTFIPDVGSWVGATPEILINIDKNRQFQTVALAATQTYRDDVDLEDTTWSQKDIEEQAMVSRYIINCFKIIRLREFEEIGPRTHISGNLVHLKTDYKVDMDQVAYPQLDSVMLELLHPTSAVCGMPKEPAKDFIMENEDFDREYFSGFLGPVNVQSETNIFVNLRCMKLLQHHAKLFAGAGIISNSNPEKEWNETEIKM
ncbi:MAG: chorismate-binding protein, partial [Cyclobacteriaceae bacterium]|nr:chorismate-binding protein [Cyclobacteriaceae bacterium]